MSLANPAPGGNNPQKPTTAPKAVRRIGDILIEEGSITPQMLDRALTESRATGTPVGTVLVKLGYMTESALGKALATLHGMEYVEAATLEEVAPEVIALLPHEFVKRNLVIPIRLDKQMRRLEVVMSRPDNVRIVDEVSLITGYRVIPRITTYKEVLTLFDKYYTIRHSTDDAMKALEEDLASRDNIYADSIASEIESEISADDAPVVQLVNSILLEAIETGASDVHIEPQKERLLIRYRIDGILKEAKNIPKFMANPLISRVKVSSGMDIAERRRPQDGRMKLKVGSSEIDMRVNTIAVQFGEKICIRILKPTATTGGLEKLGLTSDEAKKLYKMIKAPNGIVLVTGPTGSGKTTTLYSAMREINTPELNISTIEDPIEYPLAGINQTQISHKAGLNFALCLRALLRQDPDVIMVGEIRDHETLEAAVHAALTGHLVFSTLHTNSTAKTITRLLEMGAASYLVSTAVLGILAQRLIRRICGKCKESYTATVEELEILGMQNPEQDIILHRGTGCERCGNSGYEGRVGLYEIMTMCREVQELIDQGASTFSIQDAAVRNGMLTLAMDGKRKILAGLTTVEEVTRVLGLDLND
ncbi:MAG: Flp pilus assembly complex ATPase component TadA [Cyanobacteria bacterium]|nr:Flp pilus assembly complex ATPase component TadA [Cyanobacteriota bacterium]